MAYSPSTFQGWNMPAPDDTSEARAASPATRAHSIMTGGLPYVPSLRHHMRDPPYLERPRMTADHVLLGHNASPRYSPYRHSAESSQVRGTVREIYDADASTTHSSDDSDGLMLPPLRRSAGREQKRHGIVFRPNELVSAHEAFIMAKEAEVAEADELAEKRKFTHRASSAAGAVFTAGRNVKRRLSLWFRKDSAMSASDEEKLVSDHEPGASGSISASEGLVPTQVDGTSEVQDNQPPSYRPGREAEAEGRRERAHTRTSEAPSHPFGYRKNRFSRGAAETPEHLRPKLSDHQTVTQPQLQEMLELHVGEAYQRGRLDERAIASRFEKACGNTTNPRDQAVVSDDLRRTVTENKLATDRTWRHHEKLRSVEQRSNKSKRRAWPFRGGQKKQVSVSNGMDVLPENRSKGSKKPDRVSIAPADDPDPDWQEAARAASTARMWGMGGGFY